MSFKRSISSLFIGSSTFPSLFEESELEEKYQNESVDNKRQESNDESEEDNEPNEEFKDGFAEKWEKPFEEEITESEELETKLKHKSTGSDFENENEDEYEDEDENEDGNEDEDFEDSEEEYDEEEDFNREDHGEEGDNENDNYQKDHKYGYERSKSSENNDKKPSRQNFGNKNHRAKEPRPLTKNFLKQRKNAEKMKQYHDHIATEDIPERREQAMNRLRSTWDAIVHKYGIMGDDDQGDILDLSTYQVVEDNGHVESLNIKRHGLWNSANVEYESSTSYDEDSIITISSDSDSDINYPEPGIFIKKEHLGTPERKVELFSNGLRESNELQDIDNYTDDYVEDTSNSDNGSNESDLDGIISSSSQRQLSVWSPGKSIPKTSPLRTLLRSPNEDLFPTESSMTQRRISSSTEKRNIFDKLIALKHIKAETDIRNNDEHLSETKANSFSKVSQLPLPFKRNLSFVENNAIEQELIKNGGSDGYISPKVSLTDLKYTTESRRKRINLGRHTSSWGPYGNDRNKQRNRYVSEDEHNILYSQTSDDAYSEIGSELGIV